MQQGDKVTSPADINDKEQKISVAYTYKNDRMTQIEHNGFVYELLYDGFGKETAVKIAGTQAVSHTYDSKTDCCAVHLMQMDFQSDMSMIPGPSSENGSIKGRQCDLYMQTHL